MLFTGDLMWICRESKDHKPFINKPLRYDFLIRKILRGNLNEAISLAPSSLREHGKKNIGTKWAKIEYSRACYRILDKRLRTKFC